MMNPSAKVLGMRIGLTSNWWHFNAFWRLHLLVEEVEEMEEEGLTRFRIARCGSICRFSGNEPITCAVRGTDLNVKFAHKKERVTPPI